MRKLIFLLLLACVIQSAGAVTIQEGVIINTSNCSTTFGQDMSFSQVAVSEDTISFNNSLRWSNFTISTPDEAEVLLSDWDMEYPAENYNYEAYSYGDSPIDFSITTDLNDSPYAVFVDYTLNQTVLSNASSAIDFSWDSWSVSHDFRVITPGHVHLISPSGSISENASEGYTEVDFSWYDIGADRYTFYVARDIAFGTLVESSQIYANETSIYLPSGSYYWKVLPYDTILGEYGTSDVFSFSIGEVSYPGYANISVYDEKTLEQLENFSVMLYNDTYQEQKNTTIGYIEFDDTEILSGKYVAKISADGYYPRWRIINSPENITAYLPNESDSVSLIDFSLIDYSNIFNYKTSYLKVSKPGNQTLIISDMRFDASGVSSVYLLNSESYELTVYNSEYERDAGPYTPYVSGDVSLIIGDIEFIPDTTAYGEFQYSIEKTNETITFSWSAPAGSLYEMFTYNITDTSTGAIVSSVSSMAPVGMATYNIEESEHQYLIQLTANTSGGVLYHKEYYRPGQQLIDLQISDYWYNVIAIFFLAVFGLLFGFRNAAVGAFLTSIMSAGLYVVGVLRVSGAIISLVVVLGLLAILGGKKK